MVSNTDRIGAAACPWREDFDPFDASYLADPYPVFAEVRRAGPVHYAPSIDMYLVTNFRERAQVMRENDANHISKNPKPEIRSSKQIPNSKLKKSTVCASFWGLVIRICFGFRASIFGFI